MEEVNCTEVVSMATWSGTAGLVKTKTVSTLLLLRAQPGTPSGAGQEECLQLSNCFIDKYPDADSPQYRFRRSWCSDWSAV